MISNIEKIRKIVKEHQAAKVDGIDKGTPLRDIQSIGVIGGGTMGGGIAMSFANAGIPVTLLEINDEALQRGIGIIKKNYSITVKNVGSENAINARLRDQLPANTTYVANSTRLNGAAVADLAGQLADDLHLLGLEQLALGLEVGRRHLHPLAALVAVWETAVRVGDIPDYVLPAPSAILEVLLSDADVLLGHTVATTSTAWSSRHPTRRTRTSCSWTSGCRARTALPSRSSCAALFLTTSLSEIQMGPRPSMLTCHVYQ